MTGIAHVSTANPRLSHEEVILAADPSNPGRLVACAIIEPPETSGEMVRDVAYTSNDGGATWRESLQFGGALWASDPSCAFGRGGAAYYGGLIFDSLGGRYKGSTAVYGSRDGGQTWSRLTTFAQEGDREFLTVDQPRDRLYIAERYVGTTVDGGVDVPLVVSESDDGGRTYQTQVSVASGGKDVLAGYPGGVLADGTFATAFSVLQLPRTEAGDADSGTAMGKIKVLLYNGAVRDRVRVVGVGDLHSCVPWRNSVPLPSLAVDTGSAVFAGRLYVAWPDARSGHCEILLSSSADTGKTWSMPVAIDDDRPGSESNQRPDDFHPVIAVSPAGVVGVQWYDRWEAHDNLSWRPRFAASVDGGQTFLSSVGFGNAGLSVYQDSTQRLDVRGSGLASLPVAGVDHIAFGYEGHGITGGETAGLAADASGVFHCLWIDNRTGVRQVWTAQAIVDRPVVRNGSGALSGLDDVSGHVALLWSGVTFDRVLQTITANLSLQNTSGAPLYAPFKLRVLRLRSKLGAPQLVNGGDGISGGIVIDCDSMIPTRGLLPGQRSRVRHVVIRVDHVSPNVQRGDYRALAEVVTIDAVALGAHQPGGARAAAR